MQVEPLISTSPNQHNPSDVLDSDTTKQTIAGAAMSTATTNFSASGVDLSSTIMPSSTSPVQHVQDAPGERSKATQM